MDRDSQAHPISPPGLPKEAIRDHYGAGD